MIAIMEDVWRADCIASICIDGKTVTVIRPNVDDDREYEYDSENEAEREYVSVVNQWRKALGK